MHHRAPSRNTTLMGLNIMNSSQPPYPAAPTTISTMTAAANAPNPPKVHASSALKYVDHTYRDFSRYVEEGGELIKHKKSTNDFPARLHKMLTDESANSGVITWMPHGRVWKIIDKHRLIAEVLPNYYTCKKYESFSRQLNGWGFKRLHQSGPDFGCYYHECFLRDMPELTCLIRRLPPNLGKSTPYAEGEPNFYRISQEYPLPPTPPGGTPPVAPAQLEVARVRAASLESPLLLSAQGQAVLARGSTDSRIQYASSTGSTGLSPVPAALARASTNPEYNRSVSPRGGSYYFPSTEVSGYAQNPLRPAGYPSNGGGYPYSGQQQGYGAYSSQVGYQQYPSYQYDTLPNFDFPPLPNRVPNESHRAPTHYAYPEDATRVPYAQQYQAPMGMVMDYAPPSATLSTSGMKCLAHPDCSDCPSLRKSATSDGQEAEKNVIVMDPDPYAPIPVTSPRMAAKKALESAPLAPKLE